MDENVEYEEREDEFDIVSEPPPPLTHTCFLFNILPQEDEAELAQRKMKAEEEEVDITNIAGEEPHDQMHPQAVTTAATATATATAGSASELDEDLLWADEEPDDDYTREFHLKVVLSATDQDDVA